MNIEDQTAEKLFRSTTIRSEKYSVRLPFKQKPDLGKSFTGTLSRLQGMKCKFNSNNKLREEYSEFMREYFSMGHMELVP